MATTVAPSSAARARRLPGRRAQVISMLRCPPVETSSTDASTAPYGA
jgi:hypothetical protein